MGKQTLVQLAFPATGDESIGGYLSSPKLDGHRVLWVPYTRDMRKSDVQFANCTKDSRFVNKDIRCSGLWSRYGHPIYATARFLNLLPTDRILDGEMGFGRGTFQQTSSVLKSTTPDPIAWWSMKYRVFDLPSPFEIFAPRIIEDKTRNYYVTISTEHTRAINSGILVPKGINYKQRYEELCDIMPVVEGWGDALSPQIAALKQEVLPERGAWDLADLLASVEVDAGGEGSIIRAPHAGYATERSHYVMKIKPRQDAEATIIGWTAGKTGKALGMVGSLIVTAFGKVFSISGLNDSERLLSEEQRVWANMYPGKESLTSTPVFAINSVITFTYRELSDDGIPKEAQYKRKYNG